MSRSGYTDDPDNLWLYRANVDRALAGRRGQDCLRAIREALDAMPKHELTSESFQQGGMCTLGALAAHRGVDVSDLEPEWDGEWGPIVDQEEVARRFGIATCMAAEIMYENDDCGGMGIRYEPETPERRWRRMRAWVESRIAKESL